MDESMCWLCHKITKWFYENMLILRTKHTEKKIPAMIKNILGKESTAAWCLNNSVPICFKCVSRFNEYDEACQKLQIMEQELKSMISVNVIVDSVDADADTNPTDELAAANGIDTEQMDVDQCIEDFALDTSKHPVDVKPFLPTDPTIEPKPIELNRQPENSQATIDEPIPIKSTVKKEKSDFYCDPCKKAFRNKQGLMLHTFHSHVNSQRFECPTCNKVYRRKNHLEMHLASNCSTQKNFKCPVCPRKFFLSHGVKVHMKKHGLEPELEPPFPCEYCGIEFDDFKIFTDHRQLHLDRPQFQCLECDNILSKRHVLRQHMMIHTKKTPHLCEICAKSFSRAGALKMHIKRHYNEYNAECYLCKHKEMTMSKMQLHMRTHTGEKPFACSKCEKRFSDRNNRDAHFKLHFGPTEKTHKCTMCTEAFSRPGLLSKHYLNSHGIQLQPTTKRMIKVKR